LLLFTKHKKNFFSCKKQNFNTHLIKGPSTRPSRWCSSWVSAPSARSTWASTHTAFPSSWTEATLARRLSKRLVHGRLLSYIYGASDLLCLSLFIMGLFLGVVELGLWLRLMFGIRVMITLKLRRRFDA
jgi:hypothetical protein